MSGIAAMNFNEDGCGDAYRFERQQSVPLAAFVNGASSAFAENWTSPRRFRRRRAGEKRNRGVSVSPVGNNAGDSTPFGRKMVEGIQNGSETGRLFTTSGKRGGRTSRRAAIATHGGRTTSHGPKCQAKTPIRACVVNDLLQTPSSQEG
jgi:hypothetical protein